MCDIGQELDNAWEDTQDFGQSAIDTVVNAPEQILKTTQSVVRAINTTADNIIRNPLPTIETAVLISMGVPPLIASSAVTAANGGSMEQIALSAATSWAATQIGSAVGDQYSSIETETLRQLGPQYADEALIKQIIVSSSGSAAVTALKGGSFEQVLKASVSGAVDSYINASLKDSGYTNVDSKIISSAASAATRAILNGQDIGTAIGNSVASTTLSAAISGKVDQINKNNEVGKGLYDRFTSLSNQATSWFNAKIDPAQAIEKKNYDAYVAARDEYTKIQNQFDAQYKIWDDNKYVDATIANSAADAANALTPRLNTASSALSTATDAFKNSSAVANSYRYPYEKINAYLNTDISPSIANINKENTALATSLGPLVSQYEQQTALDQSNIVKEIGASAVEDAQKVLGQQAKDAEFNDSGALPTFTENTAPVQVPGGTQVASSEGALQQIVKAFEDAQTQAPAGAGVQVASTDQSLPALPSEVLATGTTSKIYPPDRGAVWNAERGVFVDPTNNGYWALGSDGYHFTSLGNPTEDTTPPSDESTGLGGGTSGSSIGTNAVAPADLTPEPTIVDIPEKTAAPMTAVAPTAVSASEPVVADTGALPTSETTTADAGAVPTSETTTEDTGALPTSETDNLVNESAPSGALPVTTTEMPEDVVTAPRDPDTGDIEFDLSGQPITTTAEPTTTTATAPVSTTSVGTSAPTSGLSTITSGGSNLGQTTSATPSLGALPTAPTPTMLAAAPLEKQNMVLSELTQLYPQLANVDPRLLQVLSGKAKPTSYYNYGSGSGGSTPLMNAGTGAAPASGMPFKASTAGSSNLAGLTSSTGAGALSRAGLSMLDSGNSISGFAKGGLAEHKPEFITGATGHHVKGEGDGQSDSIPAMLADGEYVFDADTVAALGNGSNDAGAAILDRMRQNLRKHKRSASAEKIPPKAKSPLEYMKG